MKIIKKIKSKDKVEEKVVHICPVCGGPMDETYMGRDYCDKCAAKLKGDK